MDRLLNGMTTPLEDQSLRAIFDSPDYGRDYDCIEYSASDYISVLFEYLHSLPEPLLPNEASTRFQTIWWHLAGSGEKALAMRSTLQGRSVPATNLTLILFLLNFFAIVGDQPHSPGHLAKELHSCFLVDGGQRENPDIVAFLITHAREILMPTTVVDIQPNYEPESRQPTTDTPRHYPIRTIVATSPGRASPKRRKPLPPTNLVRSSDIDPTDPSWEPQLKELRAMDITDDQIRENAGFITSYVNREKELKKESTRTGKPHDDSLLGEPRRMGKAVGALQQTPQLGNKAAKQAYTMRHLTTKELRKQGYTDHEFELYNQYLAKYVEQEGKGLIYLSNNAVTDVCSARWSS